MRGTLGGVGMEIPIPHALFHQPVRVVNYDLSNWDLKVAHCSNKACTAATVTTVDSAGDVGSGSSVTIGSDGLPIVSYYDYTTTSLETAHCSDSSCTSATITTIDTGLDAGLYSSITIGPDGLAMVTFLDDTDEDLEVVHCSNVLCIPYVRRR